MKTYSPIKNITDRLDVIAGTIGIFIGIFIIYLYYAIHLRQQDIGFTILIASSIYMFLRNKFKKTSFQLPKTNIQWKLILNIIFFTIFSITLFIWYNQLYHRPLVYFILTSFLTGIIAIEILFFKDEDSVWPILLKVLIISLSIRAGIFFNFPSLMGYDEFWHAKIAEWITNTGHVPPMEISDKYFYYPIFHIFLSMAQIIYDTDIKNAISNSIGIISVISTIFIYVIVNKISGQKTALLATLLVNITNNMIDTGLTNITPGSIVLLYFLMIIYLYFKEEHKLINDSLILFITFLMVITHQLSTFVTLISLISIYLAKYIFKFLYNERINNGFIYIMIFAISVQSYWMNTYTDKRHSFFDYVTGPLIDVLKSKGEYGNNILIVGYDYQRSILEELMLHSSYLILPFLAIGGILLWLSLKDRNKFQIVTTAVVLYVLAYGIPLFGMRNMLTDRWMPFVTVFLVVLASAYIFKILLIIESNHYKIFAMLSIVFIYSFFMITTPGINKDSPLVAGDTTIRNQYKYSELSAVRSINNIYYGKIRTDLSFQNCFIGMNKTFIYRGDDPNIDYFDESYIESDNLENNTLVILRNTGTISIKYSKLYGVSKTKLVPKEFFNRFEHKSYDLLYNNGDISAYMSKI